jgi:hypothetical protein
MAEEVVRTRAPIHLWIVGILSLLWNLFGAIDYMMTRTRNMEYLSQMGDPSRMLAYIEGMPMWAQAGWGLGVWAALAGSVLLLMRSQWAMWAFALSLIGMALSFGEQYLGPPPPPEMTEGAMKYMPIVIIIVGIAQFWYARAMEKKGVLR